MFIKSAFNTVLFSLLLCSTTAQKIQVDTLDSIVSSGRLIRLHDFPSSHVEKRNIDVWLPANFNAKLPHQVIYMHDGQMLFDSSSTWNHQSWDVEKTISKMITQGQIGPVVVVGIWNNHKFRHEEYFPEAVWQQMDQLKKDSIIQYLKKSPLGIEGFTPKADNYLRFISEEVMPYLQEKFELTAARENIFIAGSSMGGLISWYALCKYPEKFGGAACISTHWPGVHPIMLFTHDGQLLHDQNIRNPVASALTGWLLQNLPQSASHRLYFDTGDQTLDALYPYWQEKIDAGLKHLGYDSNHWKTVYYPGTDHSENAWRSRFDKVVLFLCGYR